MKYTVILEVESDNVNENDIEAWVNGTLDNADYNPSSDLEIDNALVVAVVQGIVKNAEFEGGEE